MSEQGFMGTEGGAPTPAPAAGNVTEPAWDVNAKYPAGIDETIKGDPTLKAFVGQDGNFNIPNIMKTLVHQQKMIGRDKIAIPSKVAPESEWQEVYHKLGLPKDQAEYKVEAPEAMKGDTEFIKKFSETAWKNGIMPKQAQAILNHYNETLAEGSKAREAAMNTQYEASVNGLKQEWGEAYERKLHVANKALEFFTDEETRQHLSQSGLLNDPKVTKLFVKIGETMGEDKVLDGVNTKMLGQTPDELDAEITKLHDPAGPLYNKLHKDHSAYMKKYQELLVKRHGNAPIPGMSEVRPNVM
jgi:hypothetical protein